jgi:hypothetical protein
MQFVCLSSSPVSLRSLRQPFFYWRRHLSVIPPLSVLILSYRGSSSTLQRRRLYIPIGNPILSYPILYQRHASHRPTPLFIVGIFFFIFFCFASVILSLFLLLGFDLSFFFLIIFSVVLLGSLGITWQVQQTHVRAHCVNCTGRDIGDSTLKKRIFDVRKEKGGGNS